VQARQVLPEEYGYRSVNPSLYDDLLSRADEDVVCRVGPCPREGKSSDAGGPTEVLCKGFDLLSGSFSSNDSVCDVLRFFHGLAPSLIDFSAVPREFGSGPAAGFMAGFAGGATSSFLS